MNVSMPPLAKNTRGRGFAAILIAGIALAGIISPRMLHAQQKETKSSVGVTLGGVTPMGEIRIELPAGTTLTIEERAGDILKVNKGPFYGSIPVQQTTLYQPSPTPTTDTANVGFSSLLALWEQTGVDHWTHRRADTVPMATAFVLIILFLFLVLLFVAIRRRRTGRTKEQILKTELQLVRQDLQELHSLLDTSRKQPMEVTLQPQNEDTASCPHCEKIVLLSSLQKGANTCTGCGGAFLYE